LGKGPRDHETLHHVTVLVLAPHGLLVVWADLLEESLEVVCRRQSLTLVTVRGSHDVPHVGAAHHLVVAIAIIGHGCSPLRTLLAPPLATLGALPSTLDSDVTRCLLAAAWGRLPAFSGKMKFGRLAIGGILSGNTTQLLGVVPKNVDVSAQPWVLRAVFGSRAHAPPPR
jgi:hypothetical protein